MCYSGIYIKENSTLEDFQEIIDSAYSGVFAHREMDENLRLQNLKLQEEATIIYANGAIGGVSGVSSSVNSKDYISHIISQAYYVADKCTSNWIDMWKEKFKDDSEVLSLLNRKWK
jgi:hypothetical protein